MRIINYHTPQYAGEAARLESSVRRLGVPFHIEVMDDLGSWGANCQRKATFIRDQLTRGPVLWVDADAIVWKLPNEMPSGFDIAFHRWRRELLTGTVMVYPTDGAFALIDAWIARNNEVPGTSDQLRLDDVITGSGAAVGELGPEWCFIFDLMRRDNPDVRPMIEHFQASRRLKHVRC